MTPAAPAPSPPDLRRAVRVSAVLSLASLLAAGFSGLAASAGGLASAIHAASVAFALPVSFLAHLIALVHASAARSDPS